MKLEKQIAKKEKELSALREKERQQQGHKNLSPAYKDIVKWHTTKRNIIICVLILLSVGLGSYSFYLNKQYAALDHKCERFKARVQELKDEAKEINAEYNFFHNSAVMVTEYGKRYHSYGCKHLENSDGYYIYNIENAKYQGYTPCQDCNPPQ